MAEATATAIQEVRRTGHETPEGSFSRFGALSWFSSNLERTKNKTWLENTPIDWQRGRGILAGLDWRKVLPTAIWQRGEFDKDWTHHIPITETERDSRLSVFEKIFHNVFNSSERKAFSGAGGQNVIFGKPDLDDKVFRLYINPKLDFDAWRRALTVVNEIFRSKGVIGQLKGYSEDMYDEISKDKFITGKSGNRLVVYLDAKDGQNITKLLQGLADSNIFEDLEDSGDFAFSARIPIARGISFVEGRSRSWDMQDSKDLEIVRWIIRQLQYRKKSFPQVLGELEKTRDIRDLAQPYWDPYSRKVDPYNTALRFPRNPKMPGLLATSPVRT